jgi:predicted DNA-binding ribbon-helix-helix protein
MAEFWDTHSLADYEDQTHEVEMTFDRAARWTSVPLEPELWEDLHRVARERRVSLQTLVNVWLRQRVDQVEVPASLGS